MIYYIQLRQNQMNGFDKTKKSHFFRQSKFDLSKTNAYL